MSTEEIIRVRKHNEEDAEKTLKDKKKQGGKAPSSSVGEQEIMDEVLEAVEERFLLLPTMHNPAR